MTVSIDIADAFDWLAGRQGPVMASIPTATEVGMEPDDWWTTFVPASIDACLTAARGHPAVFVQTDRLAGGRTYSWLTQFDQITWHKIALTRSVGSVDLHRPTFRHIVAVGGKPGTRTADVEPDGPRAWANGCGINTARRAAAWITSQTRRPILNPFCGYGTFLYAVADLGCDAYGCDLDPDHARHALSNLAGFVSQT